MNISPRSFLSLVGLPIVALTLLLVTGCNSGQETVQEEDSTAAAAPGTRVETLVLEPTAFEDAVELTGSIESLNDAQLSSQMSGTVEYVAPLGTQVARGEVVVRIDQDLAQAAVEQAQAAVQTAQSAFDLAEDQLRRQEPLYRDSIISALEYQNVRAQYNQAKAQLDQAKAAANEAQKQLQNTTLTAPFSGTVEEHFIEEGEQIAPGTPALRVVSTQRVRVRTGVPERYARVVERGTIARVQLDSYGMGERTAQVTFVGQAINPQNRTFPIEIELDNPDGALKPEMVARVVLPLQQYDDAIVIPRTAVIRSEDGNSVFVVSRTDTANVANRRTVTLGPSYADQVVVNEGLQAGDELVVLGQNDLTRGDVVQVVERYENMNEAAETFSDTTDIPAGLPSEAR